jgi:long-subunit fatty acid transport protein
MIKKISTSFILLFLSLFSFAQQSTSSPYSFYGIGDVRLKGTVDTRAMGGISSIPDSIHINLQNPALLSGIKLTTFGIGGTYNSSKLNTNTQSEKNQRFALDYLSVAIPSNKLGIAFGLIPFTAVGYKVQTVSTVDDAVRIFRFEGNGGVNRVYTTFSYQLSKKLSIGADLQYNFGNIETTSLTRQLGVELSSKETNLTTVGGMSFNTAIAFQSKLNKKLSIFSSVVYTPEANLNLNNSRTLSTILFNSIGNEAVVDQQDLAVRDSNLKLPSKLLFGTAIGQVRKWILGAELTLQDNQNFGNRFKDITNATYKNGTKFSFGGYYIPKFNSFSSYWKRVTYRGGLRIENTGMIVNGQSIKDNAVTLGFGMPLGGTFSNVNIGMEFGKRGTTNADLVEENYANISVGFSFNDRWFQKRKFD